MTSTKARPQPLRAVEEAGTGPSGAGAGVKQRLITAEQAAESVVDAAGSVADTARRIPAVTNRLAAGGSRAALGAVRHPERLMARARKLAKVAPLLRQALTPILTGQVEDWAAEYAYTTGMQAFVYGFPYI